MVTGRRYTCERKGQSDDRTCYERRVHPGDPWRQTRACEQMCGDIAHQQRCLEEHHTGVPHHRRPPKLRKHALGRHRLEDEEQERAQEQRGCEECSEKPARRHRPGTDRYNTLTDHAGLSRSRTRIYPRREGFDEKTTMPLAEPEVPSLLPTAHCRLPTITASPA